MHCYFVSDKRKRVELGSESSLADKDGDGYIEPFNVNPDEKNLGGTVIPSQKEELSHDFFCNYLIIIT